jgi:hypothetical protein
MHGAGGYLVGESIIYFDPHACIHTVIHRAPILHSNPLVFISISLGVSFLAYGRFCIAVINDITNYLGIACFTVRKKDENGEWKDVVKKEE